MKKKIILLAAAVVLIVIGGVFYRAEQSSAPTLPTDGAPVGNQSSTAVGTSTTTTPPTPFVVTGFNPTSGPIGTRVTLTGTGFGNVNTVTFNALVAASLKNISSDGKSISFVVPENLGPNCKPDEACPQYLVVVLPGQYKLAVISGVTTQNIGTFIVTDTSQ